MKKIDSVRGFIAAAFIGMSIILIGLGITLFGSKSTSEWSCHKADSAHFTEADSVRFEVEAKALDFDEIRPHTVEEEFASVDTLVVGNGSYFLIKNDRLFAGYSEKNLMEQGCNIDELMQPFEHQESHVTNGELWVRK